MKKNTFLNKKPSYFNVLEEIISEIRENQYKAIKTVNLYLVRLYWQIGQKIVENQRKEKWNSSIVEFLSVDLQKEFPGIRGFSSQNLWKMRQFYNTYLNNERLSKLVTQISWSHNIVILNKCNNSLEKEFYIKMTIKYGWTYNVLIHHIENSTYEKTITNQTNFSKTLPEDIDNQAKLAVKDEYIFDFLEIGENHSERELEKCLVQNIELFLAEIGEMFTFVKSQYRIEIGDKEYFIDILLYHRRLRCLIAMELKVVEFAPEHIGKMQFYLAILDDKARLKDEQPSIGIILCKSKNRTVVEYALKDTNKPIGIASYNIVSSPPKELKNDLPSPEQIIKLLENVSIKEKYILRPNDLLSLQEKTEELSTSHKKIISYIKKNNRVTNKECQTICKVKKKQATNILSSLVRENIIIKKGAGRGTYYLIKEKK